MTLTSGVCWDNMSAISLTLSRYWEKTITRLKQEDEEVEVEDEEMEEEDEVVGKGVAMVVEEEEDGKLRKCSSTTCSSRFSLGWL